MTVNLDQFLSVHQKGFVLFTKSQVTLRALAIVAALVIAVCAWLPAIQNMANSQVDAGLKRALITFASARALNAVISVVQGTEFSVQPLGVGLTLTLGQVLDPINDLVEQFSSLMLVASVAFGIQKMLLIVGAHWLISALVTAFAFIWAALVWWDRSPPWMSRVILVLVMIRFAIPVITIGSDFAFQQLMTKDYTESQRILDISAEEVKGMRPQTPIGGKAVDSTIESVPDAQPDSGEANETDATKKPSWRDRLKKLFGGKLPSVGIDYDGIKKSLASVPERVITLIVIFLAQTIIIPLVLTWALYVVVRGTVRPSHPRHLKV